MALIKCKECKKEVSSTAKICPNCGIKNPNPTSSGAIIFFVVLAIVIISNIGDDDKKTNQPPKPLTVAETRQKQIENSFSVWDGSHRNLERHIKKTMHNPDSYKHESTVYRDMGEYLVVTTTFRGANAFGGIVMNSVTAKVGINGSVLEIIGQGL